MKSYRKAIKDDEGGVITEVALCLQLWWLTASHLIPHVSHSAATIYMRRFHSRWLLINGQKADLMALLVENSRGIVTPTSILGSN
jgi:hypothetical protein